MGCEGCKQLEVECDRLREARRTEYQRAERTSSRIVTHLRMRGRQLIDEGAPGGATLIDEADRIEGGGRLFTPEVTL